MSHQNLRIFQILTILGCLSFVQPLRHQHQHHQVPRHQPTTTTTTTAIPVVEEDLTDDEIDDPIEVIEDDASEQRPLLTTISSSTRAASSGLAGTLTSTTSVSVLSSSTPPNHRMLPDRCLVKLESGPCTKYVHKWAFNKTENKCITFIYGGCLGNENNFNSEVECMHYCIGGPERE